MLDGVGSMTGSLASRRCMRHTAMLSSSMAVTRSRSAIHTGRRHYSAPHSIHTRALGLQMLQSNLSICVLFFSRPRCEGWPHRGRTFSIYLCPQSLLLTLHGQSCPRLDVVRLGCAWSSSPACTWHCSLHYLFLQATPLFAHGVTIVC